MVFIAVKNSNLKIIFLQLLMINHTLYHQRLIKSESVTPATWRDSKQKSSFSHTTILKRKNTLVNVSLKLIIWNGHGSNTINQSFGLIKQMLNDGDIEGILERMRNKR